MNGKTLGIVLGSLFVLGGFLFLSRNAAQKAVDVEAGFTDIPGPIDEIASVTNRLSGGLLARFGSFLGESISGFTDDRTVDELTGTDAELSDEKLAGFVGPPRIG